MALTAILGPVRASLAVDTGAAVNVLSERAYRCIKRASRGSQWPLRPNNLWLKSVNNETLHILGIVTLPMSLGKKTNRLKLDFYVVSDFSLPTDGLLGLTTLKSHKMVIKPDENSVLCQGRRFKAMDQPMSLTGYTTPSSQTDLSASTSPGGVLAVQLSSPASSTKHDTDSTIKQWDWKEVRATVVGDHEVPDRVTMHVPIYVQMPPLAQIYVLTVLVRYRG